MCTFVVGVHNNDTVKGSQQKFEIKIARELHQV